MINAWRILFAVALLQGCVVFVICLVVGFRFDRALYLPVALVFMFLVAVLFTAIGTAIGSVLEDMQGFQLIMNFIVMPTFFLSGALFPLKDAPRVLSIIATFDPLTYGVDGLRETLTSSAHFGIGIDFIVLGLITGTLLAIGSYLFSKIQV